MIVLYKAKSEKNVVVLILVILIGIVIGGLLGEGLTALISSFQVLSFLSWLNYGIDFGLKTPFALDLGMISFSFGFTVKFTICGIICVLAAIFIYRKI